MPEAGAEIQDPVCGCNGTSNGKDPERQAAAAQSAEEDVAECRGYTGPGGACYSGPGGGLYSGPGDGRYSGPGGGLYSGPEGGLYSGPGGGIYTGPPSKNGYKGPWGPCITGVKGRKWMAEHCPG
jgi:hypothetical protein